MVVTPATIQSAARLAAAEFNLPEALVIAIVEVESGYEPDAWNPEQRYSWFWNYVLNAPFRRITAAESLSEYPPKDFPAPAGVDTDAEWWGQQASWGLMQVMGAVARERGYRGKFFTSLCSDWNLGLRIGCHHLSVLRNRYFGAGQWFDVIAAYNAGSPRRRADGRYENQDYVNKVNARWRRQ